MDPVNIATVLVALIAALGAWASQRAAARAALQNTQASGRVDMEKDAYDRARAFDTETIRRQDEEIAELRKENKDLQEQVKALRLRIARLERGFPNNLQEALRERLEDEHPPVSE